MLHRLGHGEIHQADAHARGEQHGQPGDIGKVRLGVVRSQFQTPGRPDRKDRHEQQESGHRSHVEPAEGLHHPGLGASKQKVGGGGGHQGEQQQGARDGAGPPEDARVHLGRQHGALAHSDA
ncbi:hypothetical protein D3C72_1898730 [compost metagenome]